MTKTTTLAADIRQMMIDWNNANDQQRQAALKVAAEMAARAERKIRG